MTTRALVAINEIGTIVRANRSLCTLFGYEAQQLLGKNVKMMMPEDIAAQHDGFLRAYRETGIKHVVDSARRVTAISRQGRLFEVELNIRELKVNVGKLFIGFVDDVSQRKELSIAASLSDVVLQLVPAPLVVINSRGIVTHFNRAAEATFEFEAAQIIGKNVKLLMPSDVAKHHDDYLLRYAQTGEKKIVDGIRDVEGETKTGQRLQLRISVREVKKQGNETIFIGFLQRLS
jgi:PAS domain S-box-containing protein